MSLRQANAPENWKNQILNHIIGHEQGQELNNPMVEEGFGPVASTIATAFFNADADKVNLEVAKMLFDVTDYVYVIEADLGYIGDIPEDLLEKLLPAYIDQIKYFGDITPSEDSLSSAKIELKRNLRQLILK